MAHHDPHVCGALPRLQLNVGVDFCRSHQAWSYTMTVFEVDGEEIGEYIYAATAELGPFDTDADVLAAFAVALAAARGQA